MLFSAFSSSWKCCHIVVNFHQDILTVHLWICYHLYRSVLPINYHYQPINFWLLSTCLDENSPQFDSFLSVCMMVTAYSFVQHTVTHDYSVLTSIMKFNWKQTKTHSEKQKEVLELENTLFSTKNACKEWPIGFMIWPINFLNGPLKFWGRGHGPI